MHEECELEYASSMEPSEYICHYGVARRSGRYPWGSGDDPFQRTGTFASRVRELRKQGFTYTDKDGITYKGDAAICRWMGIGHQELRAAYEMAKDDERIAKIDTAKALLGKGYSRNEVVQKMGLANESTLRSLLNADAEGRTREAQATADFIKKHVDESGMFDVGGGVEKTLNISREKLNEALYILEGEGYHTVGGRVPQTTNAGRNTILRVILPKDTENVKEKNGEWVSSEIYNYDKINNFNNYVSHDDGQTYDKKWVYPASMDPKRVAIRSGDEGGLAKDGLVEIRPNVPDLSLGNSAYAQVRILVGGTHYIKGMAVYNNDLPEGIDVVFNSHKSKDTPMFGPDSEHSHLKPIKKDDPNNPFGSLIKPGIDDPKKSDSYEGGQSYYYDKDGKRHLSLINKRAEEGDWGEWANQLSSQFLAKQNPSLINRQLKKTMEEYRAELDDIMTLTNPVVKQHLLDDFAGKCDHTSVHLSAKALPRQQYQVILPLKSISDKEIYAPNYEDGEQVALVRYPHGGLFEIPILTVNNRNREGRKIMGTSPTDAVGINSKTAEILSGADFDGDTVMVIPTGKDVKISNRAPLEGLKGFDPSMAYPYRDGMQLMSKENTGHQMGMISNLIADMTIMGAPDDELEKVVRHSMVVIDAAKHKLDYKRSEQENDIKRIKLKYQGVRDPNTGRVNTPPATLMTRSKSQTSIRRHQGSPKIDPKTGDLVWKDDPEEWLDKKGRTKHRMMRSNQMSDTLDARTLISKVHSPKEELYADYANYMKDLAREARLKLLDVKANPRNPEAARMYEPEVKALLAGVDLAERNRPRERQAQLISRSVVEALKQNNPDMTDKEISKAGQMALIDARARVGAKRYTIPVSDKQWEAIQAGAISATNLRKILNNTDMGRIRELSTPKGTNTISASKIAKIQALANQKRYSTSQIAEQLGLSVSTVTKYMG